jgi:hypothetical protein
LLKLFQSIFAASPKHTKGLDDDLVKRAIERVIDGTDPRLRLVSGYRKTLQDAVVCAVEHTIRLIEALPEPIELSPQQFGVNELVRGLFVSPNHLEDVLLQSRTLKDYQLNRSGPEPDTVHALLVLVRLERNVLGMKLEGEMLRRDVAQVSINFTNHRLIAPRDTEQESRREQKKRVFDYFIEMALRDIVKTRTGQEESRRQRDILLRKLRTLQNTNWSIEAALNREAEKSFDPQQVETEITELEHRLKTIASPTVTLDHYLDIISRSLKSAPEQLTRESITLKMDHMKIQAENEDDSSTIMTLHLEEFSSTDHRKAIALPVYIPFASIPPRPDFVKEASRYL